MQKLCISLKSNCDKRVSEALTPSHKDQIYSIQDFTSPDFVDRLLSFDTPFARSNTETHLSLTPLLSFIDSVTQKIDDTKLLLDNLRERYIRRAVLFCTEENKEYEIHNIKREMRKSHLNIIQYGENSSIVEQFAQLFDSYRTLTEKNQLFKANESMDDFMRFFDEKVECIVQACKEDELLTPHMVAVEQPEDLKLRIFPDIQDKVIQIHQRKIFDMDVQPLEWNRQNYLIFISTVSASFPQLIWKSRLEFLNLQSGTFSHPLRLPDRQQRDISPFRLIDSLNLIATPNYQSQLLNLYKLNSKKTQLVWRLPIRSIFTNVMNGTRFAFEMIEPQNIIVIGCNGELKLLNIFTKKAIYEVKTNISNITAISHIKSLNLLAVLGNQRLINIYSIMNIRNSLHLEHTVEVAGLSLQNSLKRIFSHSKSLFISDVSNSVLHRVRFQLNTIKQDHFNTKIASRDDNSISIISTYTSSQLLLSYGKISHNAVSCAGIKRLGVSDEKLGDVDLFRSGSMVTLFDSTETMIGYSTIDNSIIIMSKGRDGACSYPERYLKQICKPFVERIVLNAEKEEATTVSLCFFECLTFAYT